MISLYTADYVITQNDARDILENAAVAVEEGRILSVGHADLLAILFPEHRLVELGHAVIMPGLINAHTHISMSLLRGYSDDKALMDWLTQDIFPAEAKLTPGLVELGAMFSLAEMIRTGTTAFYDMYMHQRSVFRAADKLGSPRAILEHAIQSEQDSIRFYTELTKVSGCQPMVGVFEDIIRQETGHLHRLQKMLSEL